MTDIATQAFLVRPTISVWTASKLDKKATRETRDANGATAKAGVRVYKKLIAADALDSIQRIATAGRNEHRARTVPWQYDGPGAITAAGYADYVKAMDTLRGQFDTAVHVFLAVYNDERRAAIVNLGDMFCDADYPSAVDVAAKFSFTISAEPMPQSADFRVAGLSQSATDAIKAEMDTRFKAAVDAAQANAWDRVVKHVEHMQMKLAAYKPAGKDTKAEGIFRDSLVSNIQELIAVLPSLNITNDPELTAIAVRLERELCASSVETLRNDDSARQDVAEKAKDIMQDIWAKRRAGREALAA